MPKIIENVREQLLSEAKRQISERGYANTTIRSVAGECGLATGTVYNYFKSKDMLIATFVLEDWHAAFNGIKSCRTNDAEVLLKCIYDALVGFSKKHEALFSDRDAKQVFATVFSERHAILRKQIAEIVSPLIDSDEGEKDFVASFVAESLLHWTMEGEKFENIYKILGRII